MYVSYLFTVSTLQKGVAKLKAAVRETEPKEPSVKRSKSEATK